MITYCAEARDVEVVISGVTNNSCLDCTDVNDTYIGNLSDTWRFGVFCNGCNSFMEVRDAKNACGQDWDLNMAICGIEGAVDPIEFLVRVSFYEGSAFRMTWDYVTNGSAQREALLQDLCSGSPISLTNVQEYQCEATASTCTVTITP
jgi:hypothetical protein